MAMSRFSPLRSLFLLVLSLVGSWLLLVLLFALLPSPSSQWDREPSLILIPGTQVTRVYEVDHWFSGFDSKPTVKTARETGRWFFAVDYQLECSVPEVSNLWLRLDQNTTIDLRIHWSRVNTTPSLDSEEPVYLSDPFLVSVKVGDDDGINPPWFNKADATLLFWEIHHDTVLVPLRLRVYTNKLELWPDSENWDSLSRPSYRTDEPLLVLYNPFGDETLTPVTAIKARFPPGDNVKNTSPSVTFGLRKAIQSIIVPTGLYVINHFGFVAIGIAVLLEVLNIAFKLLAIFALIVFVCWVAVGRPRFGPWVQSFILTRHLVAKVLPTLNQNSAVWDPNSSDGNDGTTSKRRPQPLRGPGDFFRSASPLDDLFVTFELTKGMVEPLAFRRRGNGMQAPVRGVPSDFKFNLPPLSLKIAQPGAQENERDVEKGSVREG